MIDTAANDVIDTISVGSGPVGVAVTPDGRFVYVANRVSGTVSVVDTAGGRVVATVAVGRGPDSVAAGKSGAVYVTNSYERNPGSVSVIDTATQTVSGSVEVQRNPNRVAVTPDGGTAYVTNFRSWNVSVVDTETNAVVTTVRIGAKPSGVAASPNGAYVYVATLSGEIDVIETATNRVTAFLLAEGQPYGIGIAHTGALGYAANFSSSSVSVLDLAHEENAGSIPVGQMPFAVAVSCVGAACNEPPYTPLPTRTPSDTPTASNTPTVTSTPTVTATPTATVPPVLVVVGSAAAFPGEQTALDVSMRSGGNAVATVQNDVNFPVGVSIAPDASGLPDCAVDPDIDKTLTTFAYLPYGCAVGINCGAMRATVEGSSAPIPDRAVLYSCTLDIAEDAAPGLSFLTVANADARAPDGSRLPAQGRRGTLSILGPTHTPTLTPTPFPTGESTPTPTPQASRRRSSRPGS